MLFNSMIECSNIMIFLYYPTDNKILTVRQSSRLLMKRKKEIEATQTNSASHYQLPDEPMKKRLKIHNYKIAKKDDKFGFKMDKTESDNMWTINKLKANSPSSGKLQRYDQINAINGIGISSAATKDFLPNLMKSSEHELLYYYKSCFHFHSF